MNRSEYNSYLSNIEAFYIAEEIDGMSSYDDLSSTYYSKSPCDCCKRPEYGNRTEYFGYRVGYGHVEGSYAICDDCVYFEAYGKLDDDTMLHLDD